jgi:hypothetical protein
VRKAELKNGEKAEVTRTSKETTQTVVLSDPIGFVVERIMSLGPQVKAKIHDEQWADLCFESGSIEQILRGLREIAQATRESLSSEPTGETRRGRGAQDDGGFVAKLPSRSSKVCATFCTVDGKLFVDAIPMALKAYLGTFVQDLCGVSARKAVMTAGVCAEMRSESGYVPNM